MGDDALDAVVASGGAGGAYPQLPHGQRHVVVNHQHPLGRDFIESGGLAHGLAGEVHKGLGLHHQNPRPAEAQDIVCGLKLHLVQLDALLFRQQVHGEKAHIVPGFGVFFAGISKTGQNPLRPGGFVSKQHGFISLCIRIYPAWGRPSVFCHSTKAGRRTSAAILPQGRLPNEGSGKRFGAASIHTRREEPLPALWIQFRRGSSQRNSLEMETS
ncbi:hypothetical protein SDC9_103333 [bioreactor metagenome]|uniref:Uncharacterized protein n=1 Tax=bioreactor metagenome TaxID=1076179 RepID=A0A645ATW0_9ZZZZ